MNLSDLNTKCEDPWLMICKLLIWLDVWISIPTRGHTPNQIGGDFAGRGKNTGKMRAKSTLKDLVGHNVNMKVSIRE